VATHATAGGAFGALLGHNANRIAGGTATRRAVRAGFINSDWMRMPTQSVGVPPQDFAGNACAPRMVAIFR